MTENERLKEFAERVASPKKASTDAGSVEQFSVSEQIAALEYLRKRGDGKTKKRATRGIRFGKFRNVDPN